MESNPSWWVDEPFKTGTVLPLFWNNHEKECYYLLGKDKKLNAWSCWGGYRNKDETSPVETAIRECVEESIGLLSSLANSLKNKQGVEVIDGKHHIFVININPQNKQYRFYTIKQINNFYFDFIELCQQEKLNEAQKEKVLLGWVKGSEISQKILTNSSYNIYMQPSSDSFKVDEKACFRQCQNTFFKNISNIYIKNGWFGMEGQVLNINRKHSSKKSNKNSNAKSDITRRLCNNVPHEKLISATKNIFSKQNGIPIMPSSLQNNPRKENHSKRLGNIFPIQNISSKRLDFSGKNLDSTFILIQLKNLYKKIECLEFLLNEQKYLYNELRGSNFKSLELKKLNDRWENGRQNIDDRIMQTSNCIKCIEDIAMGSGKNIDSL